MTWLLALVRPTCAYRLNAEFKDHSELEYMTFVAAHADLDEREFQTVLSEVLGHVHTVGDVLRQIAHNERTHRDACLAEIARLARRSHTDTAAIEPETIDGHRQHPLPRRRTSPPSRRE